MSSAKSSNAPAGPGYDGFTKWADEAASESQPKPRSEPLCSNTMTNTPSRHASAHRRGEILAPQPLPVPTACPVTLAELLAEEPDAGEVRQVQQRDVDLEPDEKHDRASYRLLKRYWAALGA